MLYPNQVRDNYIYLELYHLCKGIRLVHDKLCFEFERCYIVERTKIKKEQFPLRNHSVNTNMSYYYLQYTGWMPQAGESRNVKLEIMTSTESTNSIRFGRV